MSRGWHFEPTKHALASHGVKTSNLKQFHVDKSKLPPRDLYPLSTEYGVRTTDKEKKEMVENIIHAFWWASYHNNWDYFPMNEVFDFLYDYLWEFITDWEGRHRHVLEGDEDRFDDVREFTELNEDMNETYYKLEEIVHNFDDYSRTEKINMIDEIIHLYHYSGTIFNVPSMRSKFEAYYGEYL